MQITSPTASRYRRAAWTIVALQSMAFFTAFFLRALYGPLMPLLMADLHMTYVQGTSIITAFFLGYASMQVVAGLLVDRYGARSVVTASLLAMFTPTLLTGLTADWTQVAACRLLTGMSTAMIFVPGMRLIGGWFVKRRRGTAVGVYIAVGQSGGAVAMVLTPYIAEAMGWRWVFFVTPVPALLLALLFWVVVRSSPEEGGFPPPDELEEAEAPASQRRSEGGAGDPSTERDVRSVGELISNPVLWLMSWNMFCWVGILNTSIQLLPTTLYKHNGLPLATASLLTSLFSFAGMAGSPSSGICADMLGRRRASIIGLTGFSLTTLLFALLPRETSVPVLTAVLLSMGVVRMWSSAGWTLISEIGGQRYGGLASGIVNTLGMIGSSTVPLLCGYILDTYYSFPMVWAAMAVLLALAIVPLLFVKER